MAEKQLKLNIAYVDNPATFFSFWSSNITFFGDIVNLLLDSGTTYAESC